MSNMVQISAFVALVNLRYINALNNNTTNNNNNWGGAATPATHAALSPMLGLSLGHTWLMFTVTVRAIRVRVRGQG